MQSIPNKLVEPLKSHIVKGYKFLFYSKKSLGMKPISQIPREVRNLLDTLFNEGVDDNERVVIYTIRHTFANILLQIKKLPILEVSHLLNHASIQTTIENYIDIQNQHINSDLSDLF